MSEEDRISNTFRNKTIFITGGTGFLGKVLIEKLLRCCDVKKIYLLVRTKKGKIPEERLADIFSNVLFDTLKSQNPKAIDRCKVIAGDITEDQLGISPQDTQLLAREVDFIVHSAASTRFDDSVKRAVIFNTRSTQYCLELAEKCKNLKAFIHLSTAYAFPKEKVLYEKPYKPPMDPHEVIRMVNFGSDEETERLLGDCPNTYTFSKALAEALVVEKMDKLPAIIVRPSIVCPTWQQPITGWCNNLQGPMGLFVGAGKGIIRTMYMKSDSYADFAPADLVINAILIATWNFLTNSKRDRILNLSTAEYNLSWEEIIEEGKKVIYHEVPFNGAVWYPGGSIKKSRLVHNICFYLFQLIPGILIDGLLMMLGYKPILYQIQRRIQKGGEVFEYYTNRSWNFSNLKMNEIREYLNAKEREIFKIDGDGFDVLDYLKKCILCVRRNNLKEADDTLPSARRHMKIMWIVDIVTKILLTGVVIYYAYNTYNTLSKYQIRCQLVK